LASLEGIKVHALLLEVCFCLLDDVRLGVRLFHGSVAARRIKNFGFGQAEAIGYAGDNCVGI